MTRIFDCFTFHNEIDLLRLRMSLLGSVVDKFIVAEATVTHTGEPRDLILTDALRHELGPQLEVVVVADMPTGPDRWARENHQRRALSRGLERVGAREGDIIVLTDADEIPSPACVASLPCLLGSEPVELTMRYMQYKLNMEIARPWPLARAVRVSSHPLDLQSIREETQLSKLSDAGWHFTYLGEGERIRRKLHDFAHAELTGVFDTTWHVERCLRLHVDLLGRFPIRVVPRSHLPFEIANYFDHRPELWATELGQRDRMLAIAYRITTRYRSKLGARFCDEHPVLAFIPSSARLGWHKAAALTHAVWRGQP
ncbi:MAG: hypothetical protein AB7V74_13420 [Acidimicrobiia bacterium]